MTDQPPLDLASVDDLRVSFLFGPAPGEPAAEVFVLDVGPVDRWNDTPYVDAIERVLDRTGRPPHVVDVHISHGDWARTVSRAEVTVRLGATGDVPATHRDAVRGAFRTLTGARAGAATPSEETARTPARIERESALAAARDLATTLWDDVDSPGDLSVTDEEHRADGVWSVGLAAPDQTRYQAEIGFLDADPRSAHLVRRRPAEVVDSVGAE